MQTYSVSGAPVGGQKHGIVVTKTVLALDENHAAGVGREAIKRETNADTVHIYRVDEV